FALTAGNFSHSAGVDWMLDLDRCFLSRPAVARRRWRPAFDPADFSRERLLGAPARAQARSRRNRRTKDCRGLALVPGRDDSLRARRRTPARGVARGYFSAGGRRAVAQGRQIIRG